MTGLLVVSASAVLVAYGYLTIEREQAMLTTSVSADARLVGQIMRRSFVRELEAGGREAAVKLLESASGSGEKVRFRVIALPGRARTEPGAGLSPDQVEDLRDGLEVLAITGEPPVLRVYLPIAVSDQPQPAEVLLVEESLDPERRYVSQTRLHIGTATIVLVLLMGTIAFAVGSRVVGRPFRLLTEKAERVGRGDLTGPLELHQTDEIGRLARSMNHMCEDLAQETNRRREAQGQLRHAERLATVGQLASGIAHELGTPLNVVLGRATMNASDNGRRPVRVAENSRIIVEQTERMIGIIRQLLDFARRGAAETAPADLREVVRRLVDLLRPLANEAHVVLDAKIPQERVEALVDTSLIEQALTNLVVNAIQATPEGGEVRLSLGSAVVVPLGAQGVEAPHVIVAIEDDGPGIPDEVRPHLFEPFFTTKEVGQGTGLGLPVAYGIVSDHRGWIRVESEPGRGSRFSVFLPAIEGRSS